MNSQLEPRSTILFVALQAVAIILLPINIPTVTNVPQVHILETVTIESSFSKIPIRVINATAREVCTLINNGILIPDFNNRFIKYNVHVKAPIAQVNIFSE